MNNTQCKRGNGQFWFMAEQGPVVWCTLKEVAINGCVPESGEDRAMQIGIASVNININIKVGEK